MARADTANVLLNGVQKGPSETPVVPLAVHTAWQQHTVCTHNSIAALHAGTASLHTRAAVPPSLHLFSYCDMNGNFLSWPI